MGPGVAIEIETYEYPADPQSAPLACVGDFAYPTEDALLKTPKHPDETDPGQTLANQREAEAERRFEAGRQLGLNEGRTANLEAQAAALRAAEERYKNLLASVVEKFAHEKDYLFEQIEQEVVQLALAVAARILRREAQMDPLLLTGSVRVALGQLAQTAKVRLMVPEAELELWRDAIAHIPNLLLKPEVNADDALHLGDCLIETDLGSVDLGVRAQLGEIESGFFDRPGPIHASARRHRGPETMTKQDVAE